MKYLFCLLILFSFTCCKHEQSQSHSDSQKPDTLISRERMIRILTDVHLTEAALAHFKNKGKITGNLTEDYYDAIFKKHKISKNTFTSNFNYYKLDQAEFIRMYEKVIRNLEDMKKSEKTEKK